MEQLTAKLESMNLIGNAKKVFEAYIARIKDSDDGVDGFGEYVDDKTGEVKKYFILGNRQVDVDPDISDEEANKLINRIEEWG